MIFEAYVFGGRLGMTCIGICMLVSILACDQNEPAAPREEPIQQQQHEPVPLPPQGTETTEPSEPVQPTGHIIRGYASPEEAYEQCEQARKQQRWVTALDCLTEDAQDDALPQLHRALTQLIQLQENARAFGPAKSHSTTEALKEKALHALKTKYTAIDAANNNMSAVLPTKYEYFRDIMDFLSEYGQSLEPTQQSLINVSIDGNTATGMAVNTYENGEEKKSSDINFKRINGEWFKDGEVTN